MIRIGKYAARRRPTRGLTLASATMSIALAVIAALVLVGPAGSAVAEPATIAAPADVRVNAVGVERIQWSWAADPLARTYRVAVSSSVTMSNPRIVTTRNRWLTVTGLEPHRTYYAAIRAVAADQVSRPSAITPGRTGRLPKPMATDIGVVYQVISWRPWLTTPGAPSPRYEVRFANNSRFERQRVRVTSATTARFENLERDSFYYVTVRPVDARGRALGGWSETGRYATLYDPVVLP